jgi:hypothetical protein
VGDEHAHAGCNLPALSSLGGNAQSFALVKVAMTRLLALVVLFMTTTVGAQSKPVTWTGWFSDKGCARITPGEYPRPNGTACVRKCLKEGTVPVFISEQMRAIYEVRDVASVTDNVGFHLEINAEVDEKAKTVSVKSVKRLSEVTASCLIPRKIRN